jgi:two-component system response regulator TctD
MAKILIVDDLKLVLNMVAKILGESHTVFLSEDWAKANNYIFKEKLDLILMDVEMPGVHGDKIVAILKETLKNPPKIVLFSVLPEEILSQKAVLVGADGYICKPSFKDADILLYKIQGFLNGITR